MSKASLDELPTYALPDLASSSTFSGSMEHVALPRTALVRIHLLYASATALITITFAVLSASMAFVALSFGSVVVLFWELLITHTLDRLDLSELFECTMVGGAVAGTAAGVAFGAYHWRRRRLLLEFARFLPSVLRERARTEPSAIWILQTTDKMPVRWAVLERFLFSSMASPAGLVVLWLAGRLGEDIKGSPIRLVLTGFLGAILVATWEWPYRQRAERERSRRGEPAQTWYWREVLMKEEAERRYKEPMLLMEV
ncbi:hypothetical protein BDW22DRAFT_1430718 [Trametopsis cervina]|nr:hypothetical protein BDW22DRAFT_1430718 [Trametopsis cervina]